MKLIFLPCAIASLVAVSSLTGAEPPVPPRDVSKAPQGLANSDWSSIREAYEHHRHAVVANPDGTHQARNPGQSWLTRFDGQGFTATPDAGGWSWGLELKSYGYPGHALKIAGTPAVKAGGGRLEYQHDGNLCEWFINDSRGLEQGWTLQHRPVGSEAGTSLKLELGVRGGLKAQVSNGGSAVSFVDPGGANVIHYSGLKAWDADGKSVPVGFESGENGFRVVADDAEARYPITIDPMAQQAYLKASNAASYDNFGCSVAISGDTVVVGACNESSAATGVNGDQTNNKSTSGAAYVFVRNGNTWSQQAYLKASNTEPIRLGLGNDRFGSAVGISGDTIVVGADFESSNATGVNGDQFNNAAAGSGAAYVFVRIGSSWSQQAYLKAFNTGSGDRFGSSVAISQDWVVIGAYNEAGGAGGVNGNGADNSALGAGAAYLFLRTGSAWAAKAYIKASNPNSEDYFGTTVAVNGSTLVVGAPSEDSSSSGVNGNQTNNSADRAGAAYIFTFTPTTCVQSAYLKASNTETLDEFGISVGVSGDTVVVGASGEDSGATGVGGSQANLFSANESGAAYVFVKNGVNWQQQAYVKASNTSSEYGFGRSVALTGDTLVIGSHGEGSLSSGVNGSQVRSSTGLGAAYVFVRNGIAWSQQAYLKASNPGVNASYGTVAVSGNTVIVGAEGEYSGSTGINGDQTLDRFKYSQVGAAYLYDGFGSWFSLSIVSTNGSTKGWGDYKTGTSASVSATPYPGYVFSNWSGDFTSSNNPSPVLVNSNKSISANFGPDTSDPDNDDLDNYNEIVVQGTDPNVADTDGDGFPDGYEVRYSSNPKNSASLPKFILTLVNNGIATGGSFTKSGSLDQGTIATVTATPASGYVFGNWSGDVAGTINPLALLMDSNKTVGASFVGDTGDSDGDGLDNYNESVVLGTNPDKTDTDRDGVSDGVEVSDKTDPTHPDTDRDGLTDGLEEKLGSNPRRTDSDSDGIADAEEDQDRDGISNGREANELATNPRRADSDGDGLTDTFELAFDGKTEAFRPRIGDEIRLDFKRLEFPGTMRLAGTLPNGLHFDPVKQVLKGTLKGKPGSYSLALQLFNGRTYSRSIPLPFTVAAFPNRLTGRYEGLLENPEGQPAGKVSVKVTAPGFWKATLDVAGSDIIRSASGSVSLNPAEDSARLVLPFLSDRGLKSIKVALNIDASTPLIDGFSLPSGSNRAGGSVRGFRLARGSREPAEDRGFTMVIDQGERDGFSIPAGLGWATGSLSNSGEIFLSGRLGDSEPFETTSNLSVTGQAIIWVKPYRDLDSWLGGIVSFRGSGLAGADSGRLQEPGLSWFRARDATQLSYPEGFGPIQAHAGIASYAPPASAGALAKSLGLAQRDFGDVLIEGGGLPDPKGDAVLPRAFALRDSFELVARPVAKGSPVPWHGAISRDNGTFAGTLKLPASSFGIVGGTARASGVLIPGAGFKGIVAAGLVEVPVNDRKGAFRTAAIVISK